ncbi:YIP1 family protein [Planococcus sp. APC 3906]|uniref:YIP1 family protein n=1 Tax=Planococcus sp. APC 3906 TaxID=3035194 RepID=UPI0025B4914A|nr:YIP1 family protein [Planococcus sp. APC 3906]MDN3451341.1 YIP1 family protein [Planococcus sp. APC 3906]
MIDITEKHETERVNPFTAVWLQTRKAARFVIEEKSIGFAIMLIMLSGIGSGLMGMQSSGGGAGMAGWQIFLLTVILGPVVGFASAAFLSALYLLVGKLFKGTATYIEMFKAVAVSMIPYVWIAPVLLAWATLAPGTYFADPLAETSTGEGWGTLIVLGTLSFILSIWGIIIQSKAIGEAHRFSSWKGFATVLIPAIVIGVVIVVVIILFVMLFAAAM